MGRIVPAAGVRCAGACVLRRNQRGQVVILMALSIFAILGVAALAIDGSFMYEKRNRLHAAADAAAKSAALEVRRGNFSQPSLQAFAEEEVEAMGFDPSIVLSVNCPPATGPYAGGSCGTTSSYVEVIVGESTPTFFANVLGFASMTPTARAVAGSADDSDCIITLGTSGTGLKMRSGAEINSPTCSISVNSPAAGGGAPPAYGIDLCCGAQITSSSIGVVGEAYLSGGGPSTSWSPPPVEGVIPKLDPFANLTAPTVAGTCTPDPNVAGGTVNISPGTYCSITVSGSGTLNMASGEYYITGGDGIVISGSSTINANGVFIYNVLGPLTVESSSTLNLSAMTTGPYIAIAYWAPAGNTRSINFMTGMTNVHVEGVIYAPTAELRTGANSLLYGTCLLIVVESVDLASTAGIARNCGAFGGSPLQTVSLAE
jgi:Putative Flp pilus-assembly TadE/G-like